jgi:hypothetical protein
MRAAFAQWKIMAPPGSNARFKRLNLLTADSKIVSLVCQEETIVFRSLETDATNGMLIRLVGVATPRWMVRRGQPSEGENGAT